MLRPFPGPAQFKLRPPEAVLHVLQFKFRALHIWSQRLQMILDVPQWLACWAFKMRSLLGVGHSSGGFDSHGQGLSCTCPRGPVMKAALELRHESTQFQARFRAQLTGGSPAAATRSCSGPAGATSGPLPKLRLELHPGRESK
eukprot:1484815-Alexandrium_andersonii.AAC.1